MSDTAPEPAAESNPRELFQARVLVTGATGFVGRYVLRELIARGYTAACLVRDAEQLRQGNRELPTDRVIAVGGDLFDDAALAQAAHGCQAAIHLVGIIQEQPIRGQTFHRIHVEGTRRVVDACRTAGIGRIVYLSALGTRLNAVSEYHRTKWEAECAVRDSGLDWTILRPSIIHEFDGEFMRMMRSFVCRATVRLFGFLPAPFPIIPFFGDGQHMLQPVSVRDVAHCCVAALGKAETIGQTYGLGGPEAMTWKELYRTCRELIPCAKHWKPMVGQPVWAARLMASTLMKLPILPRDMRFNVGQVQMSQEDSTCETAPAEKAFGIRLRNFREELKQYAARIE